MKALLQDPGPQSVRLPKPTQCTQLAASTAAAKQLTVQRAINTTTGLSFLSKGSSEEQLAHDGISAIKYQPDTHSL